jgi:hypothetical protein
MARNKLKHYQLSEEQKREHEELLVRISVHAEEMRQNKAQQWRTLYYSILLLVALALAFQQPVILGVLYYWVKAFSLVVVLIITVASIIHLLALKYDIDFNREASESMEEELNQLTGISGRLEKKYKPKYDVIVDHTPLILRWLPKILIDKALYRRFYNVIFYSLFVGILVLTSISVLLLIAFDT